MARPASFSSAASGPRASNVNYLGAAYCALAALPHLRASRGRLVVVSSLAGKTVVDVNRRRRVVIAEDEAIIRLDLRETLEEEGYEVVGERGDLGRGVGHAATLREPVPAAHEPTGPARASGSAGAHAVDGDEIADRLSRAHTGVERGKRVLKNHLETFALCTQGLALQTADGGVPQANFTGAHRCEPHHGLAFARSPAFLWRTCTTGGTGGRGAAR